MFSPCVFCVLPCVTSTFTVSKLARIIKQASRVGGCERVFTPVRWRQVRLSCIKWRSTFFYIFSCVRRSVGSSSSGWTAVAPTVMLGWRFCPADIRRENNVIMTSVMTLSPRRVPVGLACEAGRSPWCREFLGVLGVRSMLMSPWLRELQEAELVGKVPPVYPLSDKSVEWGGWETRVVVARDWNPAIPLVKRIFLVPDHIWPKTIKGQPALTHVIRNYVLLLVVPPLCLWWVTHIVTKALRLKILPGQQLPLFPTPPLYWLVT